LEFRRVLFRSPAAQHPRRRAGHPRAEPAGRPASGPPGQLGAVHPDHPELTPRAGPAEGSVRPRRASDGGTDPSAEVAGSALVVRLVGHHVHGGLLGAGAGAVDADVLPDQLRLHVLADAAVGIDQATGPPVTDLSVVEVLAAVTVAGLGLLAGEPVVQAGCVLGGPPALRRGVALVQDVVDPAIVQRLLGLQLIKLLGLLRHFLLERTHGASLPRAARPRRPQLW